jgi:hypothetical protein
MTVIQSKASYSEKYAVYKKFAQLKEIEKMSMKMFFEC